MFFAKSIIRNVALFAILFTVSSCSTTNTVDENLRLTEKLSKLKGVEFVTDSGDSLYKQSFKLMIEQPLDHNNPDGEKFTQKVYLSHLDINKPVVISINGYNVNRNRISELASFVDANQVYVEHRFFGESKPENYDYNYLNVEQAAADYHRIITLLKTIYKGKWISTGISKGGQTTIFYRYFYPNDVDISVPYVAPLCFSSPEPRVIDFLKNVGTKECREKIIHFQTMLLENKESLMPEFKANAKWKNYTFNIIGGIETAYEYAVLEYSFAFWQWQFIDCSQIPDNVNNPVAVIKNLEKVGCISFFSDGDVKAYQPYFYQAQTEIGIYTYDTEPFTGLLKYATKPSFEFTMPEGYKAKFNDTLMLSINKWLQNKSENFVYIYGEYDPWSAPAVQLIEGKTNALKMVNPGGSHRTRISSFLENEQKQIADSLNKWLKK